MNKYEQRTQRKKDAIIASALQLFREKGYTNVSINDISAHSGVSSVSIYNYFGSKDKLVPECARVLMQDAGKEANEILASDLGFKNKLLQVTRLCAGQHDRLLTEYFSQEALGDKVLLELYTASMDVIRLDILREFIESGRQEGVINSSVSSDTVMDYLNAISQVQAAWDSTADYAEKTAGLYHLMLYGLIGK